MKKQKLFLLLALCAVFAVTLSACNADFARDAAMSPSEPGGWYGGGAEKPSAPPSADAFESAAGEPGGWLGSGGSQNPAIKAGQLTSGEWSDLKNYEFWQSLVTPPANGPQAQDPQQQQTGGVFTGYLNTWGLETRNLVPVKVTFEGKGVQGASVTLHDKGNGNAPLYSAVSDAFGNAYLFPAVVPGECRVTAISNEIFLSSAFPTSVDFTYAPGMEPVAVELVRAAVKLEIIELMFVIDTTGSMGDEIAYLRAELADVVKRAADATGAEIRLAILLYKDHGDVYVTQYYDFTTDLAKQQAVLNTVKASGGGDFPEAVDVALEEASKAPWMAGLNTTKLIFHVLDAPPHEKQADIARFGNSILKLAELGVRLIPVASSGIDKLTEFLLRSEAMMTGGTYTFLTDDSGIGGSHIEPTVGQYVVEYLNEQMLRLIRQYYTGVEIAPVAWQGK